MIRSYRELKFYIKADAIMNEQVYPKGFFNILFGYNYHLIHRFLKCMRWLEYAENTRHKYLMPLRVLLRIRYSRLKALTGYDVPINTFGYGVRIGHLSTVVINHRCMIGNYCRLESNVVIGDANPKKIGNNVYLAPNISIAKAVEIADGCSISAGSFLNSNCLVPNTLLGGYLQNH